MFSNYRLDARKQMVEWLPPHFAGGNEIVDLFYAITDVGLDQANKDRSHGSSVTITTAATEASSGNALPQIDKPWHSHASRESAASCSQMVVRRGR
jgi:hypothetical protein